MLCADEITAHPLLYRGSLQPKQEEKLSLKAHESKRVLTLCCFSCLGLRREHGVRMAFGALPRGPPGGAVLALEVALKNPVLERAAGLLRRSERSIMKGKKGACDCALPRVYPRVYTPPFFNLARDEEIL